MGGKAPDAQDGPLGLAPCLVSDINRDPGSRLIKEYYPSPTEEGGGANGYSPVTVDKHDVGVAGHFLLPSARFCHCRQNRKNNKSENLSLHLSPSLGI